MIKTFGILLLAYLALCAFLFLYQRKMIYFPDTVEAKPALSGAPEMQVIQLKTKDGLNLKSWYAPPKDKHKPVLLYFHGNAGQIRDRVFFIKPYLRQGYGVLLLGYRGYGGNPGSPTEQGLYHDGRAAMDYLIKNGNSPKCIVLFGESLGSGVAIQMALEYDIAALVLQSPYTSLGDVAQYHYFYLPAKWFVRDKFHSISKIKKVHSPLLIIHGSKDKIIPAKMGRALLDAANTPKKGVFLAEKSHNDLDNVAPLVISFLSTQKLCQP